MAQYDWLVLNIPIHVIDVYWNFGEMFFEGKQIKTVKHNRFTLIAHRTFFLNNNIRPFSKEISFVNHGTDAIGICAMFQI